MGVDVVGDVAVTMFARRGVGCSWSDTHALSKRDGEWRVLGGGSGTAGKDLLADRPALLSSYLADVPDALTGIDPRLVTLEGGGGVRDSRGAVDWLPGSTRWISYVVLRVSAPVASLETDGRTLVVPWHGRVVIASITARPLPDMVRDARGRVLGEVRPHLPRV